MAKRLIKTENELPHWFSMKNYESFSKLTLIEYLKQIIIRIGFYHAATEESEIFEPIFFSPVWEAIKSGEPIVDFDLDNSFFTEDQKLYNFTNIGLVDYPMVSMAVNCVENFYDLYLAEDVIPEELDDDMRFQAHLGRGRAWLELDLNNVSDEEIINEIRNILPEIRRFVGVESPKLSKVNKLIGCFFLYRCHIYLDLLIWELEASVVSNQTIKITKPLLLDTLFPESDEKFGSTKDLENKTIRITKELLNNDFSLLRKIQFTLQTDTYLSGLLISTFSELKNCKSA